MIRRRPAFVRAGIAACAFALGACSSGGGHVTPQSATNPANTGPTSATPLATTLTFEIPKPGSPPLARGRYPAYITSATASMKIAVTDVKLHGTSTDITPNPLPAPQIIAVTTGGNPNIPGQCGTDPANANNIKCTESILLPLGDVTIVAQTYDGANATGNVISQQQTVLAVLQGQANAYTFTFDAALSSIGATSASVGVGGTAAIGFTITVTTPVNFTVTPFDGHGSPIADDTVPGTPTIGVMSANPAVAAISGVAQNPFSFVLTPGTPGSTTQVTITATPAGSAAPLSLTFNVTTAASLIAAGESNVATGQVDLFTLPGASFSAYGRIPSAALGSYTPAALGFDGTNELYLFDNNNNVVLEFPAAELSQTSGQTFTTISSGITGGNGLFSTFSLARDGSMAVGNSSTPSGTLDQIVGFAPRATTPTLTRALGGPQANYFYRAGASTVITNASGNAVGYAAALESDNGTASDNSSATAFGAGSIAVVSATNVFGGGAVTCGPGTIGCFELDLSNEAGGAIGMLDTFPGLIWNRANQELIFFDNTQGTISAYTYSGSAFAAPVLVDTYTSTDTSFVTATYAVSTDGHLAVASADGAGNTILKVYDATNAPVASWTFAPGATGYTVFGLTFLPNDTLVVAGGYDNPADQLLAYQLTSGSAPIATQTLTEPISATTATLQSNLRRAAAKRHLSH